MSILYVFSEIFFFFLNGGLHGKESCPCYTFEKDTSMSWLPRQAVNPCKFNNKQITQVSQSLTVDSFSNQACMFFHSFFYEFQMEINVALATPLKMAGHCSGDRRRKFIDLARSIWWSWKQSESGNL